MNPYERQTSELRIAAERQAARAAERQRRARRDLRWQLPIGVAIGVVGIAANIAFIRWVAH